jgi:hypothetical protein
VDCAAFEAAAGGGDVPYALAVRAFGVCVHGEEFVAARPPWRVGRRAGVDVVRDRRVACEEAARRRRRGEWQEERRVLQWFLKRALRAAAEAAARTTRRYARDLVPAVRPPPHRGQCAAMCSRSPPSSV